MTATPDLELAHNIVRALNNYLMIDQDAITALFSVHVRCNAGLAEHPSVQVWSSEQGHMLGILGVLNGMCGTFEDGTGAIASVHPFHEGETSTHILRFEVRQAPTPM